MDGKKIVPALLGTVGIGCSIYVLISKKEPTKYSSKWFNTVSDATLHAERENIRQQFCKAGSDFKLAVSLENLLQFFDKVIYNRSGGSSTDYKFPVHGSHGWHLPSDD